MHSLGLAVWQRAPKENKHLFIWIPGHKTIGGEYKATDEQCSLGNVQWEPIINTLIRVPLHEADASGKPPTKWLPQKLRASLERAGRGHRGLIMEGWWIRHTTSGFPI